LELGEWDYYQLPSHVLQVSWFGSDLAAPRYGSSTRSACRKALLFNGGTMRRQLSYPKSHSAGFFSLFSFFLDRIHSLILPFLFGVDRPAIQQPRTTRQGGHALEQDLPGDRAPLCLSQGGTGAKTGALRFAASCAVATMPPTRCHIVHAHSPSLDSSHSQPFRFHPPPISLLATLWLDLAASSRATAASLPHLYRCPRQSSLPHMAQPPRHLVFTSTLKPAIDQISADLRRCLGGRGM
jgi:hypothetical protein